MVLTPQFYLARTNIFLYNIDKKKHTNAKNITQNVI